MALALATSAGTGSLFAQAQSLLSSNQVVITRVENVSPTTLLISGINFEKFENVPVVSLSGTGTAVSVLRSSYDSANKDITAVIPDTVAALPGSYRLMVSFGAGTAGTDVFEFTVGAVGPKGDKGEKGEKGDKGDTGAQGLKGDKGDLGPQGIQGEKGDRGETGLQGPKGDKGDVGPQGVQGAKGDTGLQGPKGDKGDQGPVGPVGPIGLTGAPGKSGNFPVYRTEKDARAAGLKVGDIWVQDPSGQVFQIVK